MEPENNEENGAVPLSARVPESLRDEFWQTRRKGVSKQLVMAAAARLWISLPDDERERLTNEESKNQTGGMACHFPSLPKPLAAQPEEMAILMSESHARRFLEQLTKNRPSLMVDACSGIFAEALRYYETERAKEIADGALVHEAKTHKKKGGKKPKAG